MAVPKVFFLDGHLIFANFILSELDVLIDLAFYDFQAVFPEAGLRYVDSPIGRILLSQTLIYVRHIFCVASCNSLYGV